MQGELVTVEAARSGGKTTLLFCAAGMLRPDQGEVHWPGLPPRPNRPPAGIAYAADRAPPYGFLSTREALLYAAAIRELHDPGSARGAEQLIELCGLSEVADLRTSLLSPAHRARLSLATALMPGPKLLLVDDIDGGPDAVSRAAFVKTLDRITANGGRRALGGTAAWRRRAGRGQLLPRTRGAHQNRTRRGARRPAYRP
jgi:ABC-type multidrug transport system ATPase subunit